jgi:hypothetical protein
VLTPRQLEWRQTNDQTLSGIKELAREVLSGEQLALSDWYCREMLFGNRRQMRDAILRLVDSIPNESKQGDYLKHNVRYVMSNRTRDIVRYAGDYVDMLTKRLSYVFLRKGESTSLGANARELCKRSRSGERLQEHAELFEWLSRFDDVIYKPAKHHFESYPPGREHLFTVRETIFSVQMSVILGEKIQAVLVRARNNPQAGTQATPDFTRAP